MFLTQSGLQLSKFKKKLADAFGRDPDARVLHFEAEVAGLRGKRAYRDPAAFRCELKGVG